MGALKDAIERDGLLFHIDLDGGWIVNESIELYE